MPGAQRIVRLAVVLSLVALLAVGAVWVLSFAASTGAGVIVALVVALVVAVVFAAWFLGHLARDLDPFRTRLRRR